MDIQNPIIFTPKAIERLKLALSEEVSGTSIRVGVKGGGCSGFQWVLDTESGDSTFDFHFETDGVKICIDPMSAPYLKGVTIDYVETLVTQGFSFKGGTISRTCGCGMSFSV